MQKTVPDVVDAVFHLTFLVAARHIAQDGLKPEDARKFEEPGIEPHLAAHTGQYHQLEVIVKYLAAYPGKIPERVYMASDKILLAL